MLQFLKDHKKFSVISGAVLTVLLLAVYLYLLLLPGYWHGDAFLYQQKDGSFSGFDTYADYAMSIDAGSGDPEITFSVNDVTKQYQFVHRTDSAVQLYENGTLIFQGTVQYADGNYWLVSEHKQNKITFTDTTPTADALFPSYSWLYNCAVGRTEIRGAPVMLIWIFIVAVLLALDIKFPDLFFHLRYSLAVDGGEPTEWYRFSQKISRGFLAAFILGCVIASFIIH